MLLKPMTSRCLSRAAGAFMDSPLSRCLIPGFIRKNGIRLSDYEEARYRCFNDFFCRRVRSELRPICRDPQALIAPCDGLLSIHSIRDDTVLPVKQSRYTISDLLGGDAISEAYRDGLCLVFRLCVDNYHRYCYLDDGVKGANTFLPGALHTVRPIALRAEPVFVRNCREYTVMETAHFGPVTQIEVGAMLVGRILNHHGPGPVRRGDEKGMFLYGGSTVIVLLRKGRAELAPEFRNALDNGCELPIRMGQRLGSAAL
ncbi:MAG: phosphatidylserine decarboxylase [Clostridia bacterium]|nr:phosphatidylserine decarboxylase [Clostridia bacterium]